MNLYQLRYFTTLAQEEHYTKAALKLHITQPSLTHAIHLLEDELDVALFEKKGRNVVLTKYGKLFLKEIEPILNRLDDSIENIKQISKGKETLNIGFVRRLGMSYIPQLISSFQNENVTFQCHSGFSYDLIHDLKKNDLDIVFCSYVDDQDIFFKPVITQEFYVIVSLNHPLAKNKTIRMEELEEYPCLAFDQGDNPSFFLAEEVMSTYDYKRVIRANDRATMLNLMVGLNGYTLCSGIICEELNGSDYCAVPLAEDESMVIGYIKRIGMMLSPLAVRYLDELKKYEDCIL